MKPGKKILPCGQRQWKMYREKILREAIALHAGFFCMNQTVRIMGHNAL
ncbi:hypothetical protein ANACOL_02446 [Anaerotruncus colihominis DSM 17241]|uniref:Uncharacterized protein n=1 Tax=Anaerotruncus colihominis DSM 17241 TaxID=445972 RepID=B0PCD7_9FIRM|nr:hypothetical protein ANACOL_02446 [Anaerotruncus colihominis DSM 17241]